MAGENSVKVLGCAEGWEILLEDQRAEMLGELGYGMVSKEQLSGLPRSGKVALPTRHMDLNKAVPIRILGIRTHVDACTPAVTL